MIKKIDLYIIRKFLGTFIFSILIIIVIVIVFDLAEKLDEFFENKAPFKAIALEYYLNFIPHFANLFSSLFTFISVIFFTAKLAARTEIIAILSSGISYRRMLLPYFISAAIIALFSYLLGSWIIPPANMIRLDFENTYIRNPYQNHDRNIHKQVAPGIYIYMDSYNTTNDVAMKFSMEEFSDQGILKSKIIADYVKWDTTQQKWRIQNYYIRNFTEKGERIETGRQLDTTLNISPEDFRQRVNIVETMNDRDLNEFIEKQIIRGESHIEIYLIEKYRRIAYPVSTFILTLMGVAVSSRKIRGGVGAHIGFGILLSFTYILFFQISSQFAIRGNLNPFIAVWIPNILYSFIAVYLYKKAPK